MFWRKRWASEILLLPTWVTMSDAVEIRCLGSRKKSGIWPNNICVMAIYSTAIIWSAIVGLKSSRETNTHNAVSHQPIKQNMLIRALQKLSHFREKKKIPYFPCFWHFSLYTKLITDNFQTWCFTQLNGTIILATE